MRKRPQIVDFDCRQTGFLCPAENTMIQRSAKKVGKDRYNVDLHRETRSKSFITQHTEFTELSYFLVRLCVLQLAAFLPPLAARSTPTSLRGAACVSLYARDQSFSDMPQRKESRSAYFPFRSVYRRSATALRPCRTERLQPS